MKLAISYFLSLSGDHDHVSQVLQAIGGDSRGDGGVEEGAEEGFEEGDKLQGGDVSG